MDEKSKQNIGIGIGTSVVISVGGILGYWYYRKLKRQAEAEAELERLIQQTPLESPKEDDYLDDYNQIYNKKSRFFVYDNSKVSDRFKVMGTDGDSITKREKGRLRVSGNRYRKDTPSGYNKNNRNADFSDLDIPNNKSDIW